MAETTAAHDNSSVPISNDKNHDSSSNISDVCCVLSF